MRTDAKSQSMPFMPAAAAAASVSTTLPRPARQLQHRQHQQQHLLLHQQQQQQQQQQLLRQQPLPHSQTNLNQALAIVANKWDREERRQETEATRRMTVLKQRKISAILKVGKTKEGRKEGRSRIAARAKIVILSFFPPSIPRFICAAVIASRAQFTHRILECASYLLLVLILGRRAGPAAKRRVFVGSVPGAFSLTSSFDTDCRLVWPAPSGRDDISKRPNEDYHGPNQQRTSNLFVMPNHSPSSYPLVYRIDISRPSSTNGHGGQTRRGLKCNH